MFLPLILNSQPELQSFTNSDGTVVTVEPGTTKFSESSGFDPILLLAFSQMGATTSGKNGGDQTGMFNSPLGMFLMLKLLDP